MISQAHAAAASDESVLRYRLAAARLRPSPAQLLELRGRVETALAAEEEALTALGLEAERQQRQHLAALRYSSYIDVLSANLHAASGGAISVLRVPPDAEELRQVLTELGAPVSGWLQVLHAYRLRNAGLQEAFSRRASGAPQPLSPIKSIVPANHRLLALRLPPSALEHTLVHGLHAKAPPTVGERPAWQVDPKTNPEAGCVDVESLAQIVSASAPPPPPFGFFGGAAAWAPLKAAAEEEEALSLARLKRQAQAARSHDGGRSAAAPADAAAAGAVATVADAAGTATDAATHEADGNEQTLLLLCRVLVPSCGMAGGPAECPEADAVLPLFLVQIGFNAAPLTPRPTPSGGPAASRSSALDPPTTSAYVPLSAYDPRGGGAAPIRRGSHSPGRKARGGAARQAEPEPEAAAEGGSPLPLGLLNTTQHADYVACCQATGAQMREVAGVFVSALQGLEDQLMPARARAIADEARREADLQALLADAKAELGKLKKVNRELASELQTTY